MFEYMHPIIGKEILFVKENNKYTCNVCVAASEYCRIGIGVVAGCFIGSESIFVVDDCCLSRFGENGLTTWGGGEITRGISTGIEGKTGRAGNIFVRWVTYKIYY